jgi:hypothetical protein
LDADKIIWVWQAIFHVCYWPTGWQCSVIHFSSLGNLVLFHHVYAIH